MNDDEKESVLVPREVLEGLEAVRRSGRVNMLDRPAVARIAGELGFREAARFPCASRAIWAIRSPQGRSASLGCHVTGVSAGSSGWQLHVLDRMGPVSELSLRVKVHLEDRHPTLPTHHGLPVCGNHADSKVDPCDRSCRDAHLRGDQAMDRIDDADLVFRLPLPSLAQEGFLDELLDGCLCVLPVVEDVQLRTNIRVLDFKWVPVVKTRLDRPREIVLDTETSMALGVLGPEVVVSVSLRQ
jgi:hypothetical protein